MLYFDSFMIGLTATPAGKTVGFFNQNLVMQYGHDETVIDGVNADFDVYRIRTKITEHVATSLAIEPDDFEGSASTPTSVSRTRCSATNSGR